jgi:hypothetical protein
VEVARDRDAALAAGDDADVVHVCAPRRFVFFLI